ncbi:hypothetical protein Ancab_002824 [Ancistrocladus abbreviatus]
MASHKSKFFGIAMMIQFLLTSSVLSHGTRGCGRTPIRSAAVSLSPCLGAAANVKAKVPPSCCTEVAALIKTAPNCLCAVLLSPLAKQAGIDPGVGVTIPKRCSIKNRPVGHKCGRYVVP